MNQIPNTLRICESKSVLGESMRKKEIENIIYKPRSYFID